MTTGLLIGVSQRGLSFDRGASLGRRVAWRATGLAILFALAGCETPPPPSSGAEQQHAELVLREGDAVKISFPGTPNLDAPEQVIRRDGKITLPIVGEVTAADLTPTQLQNVLIGLYADQLVSKEVIVTVVSSNFFVFVDGSVNRPGKVAADHPLTVLEAVMEAGGFDYTKANMHKIMIIRHKRGSAGYDYITLDMKGIMDGKKTSLFYLEPDDIVHVPEKFSWF